MDIISLIAEDKIKRAMKEGEFKNLPGKGKPLELEDLSSIPEDLRLGYKMLKNSGMLTDEKQLNKEIMNLQDLLKACEDATERSQLRKKLNEKKIRLKAFIEEKQLEQKPIYNKYQDKINNKLK